MVNNANTKKRRVFLYGCGVISPGAQNVSEFINLIRSQKSALAPDPQLNNAFLTGRSPIDFSVYKDWILERHPPSKYSQLGEKAGQNVRLGIATFIQAVKCHPNLERAIKESDPRVMICYGSGFGDVHHYSLGFEEFINASRKWNHFWAQPSRNKACAEFLKGSSSFTPPASPTSFEVDSPERQDASLKWNEFWAPHSEKLQEFIQEFSEIESMTIGEDVATDKLNVIRTKNKSKKALQEKYQCPTPPWEAVSANFLWNLPNAPAAQVSMLMGVHGAAYAAFGACSTFGLVLRNALDAIQSGTTDIAVIGTTDPDPKPTVVCAFSSAKVLAAGDNLGVPLTGMRGTHISSGGCTWIIAAEDAMKPFGVTPLQGIEIAGVGLSSDAEHIITPSLEGPKLCLRRAFEDAQVEPKDIDTWDMHATGTPGDWSEFKLIEEFINSKTVVTARKGVFGHAMATCGGLELTAQVMSLNIKNSEYEIAPSGINASQIHPTIKKMNYPIAADKAVKRSLEKPAVICGKLSMGVGGISACVVTRVWKI